MKTVSQIAADLDVRVCLGGCGLSATRHREGCNFLGVTHFAERSHMTHRAARNLLLLLAKAQREADLGYLNIDVFDWKYEHIDAVQAGRMARRVGFVLPAKLLDPNRVACIVKARNRGILLAQDYPAIYQWAKAGRKYLDPVTTADRFWSKVQKTETCWVWIGAHVPRGYGIIHIRSQDRNVYAHRYSWEIHYGPVPDGLLVCHTCDNPPCVRPDHLFVGSVQDNSTDAKAKGRTASGERHGTKTHPEAFPKGSQCTHAKITEDQVREIRLAAANGEKRASIGTRYGLHPAYVSLVVARRRWTHVA